MELEKYLPLLETAVISLFRAAEKLEQMCQKYPALQIRPRIFEVGPGLWPCCLKLPLSADLSCFAPSFYLKDQQQLLLVHLGYIKFPRKYIESAPYLYRYVNKLSRFLCKEKPYYASRYQIENALLPIFTYHCMGQPARLLRLIRQLEAATSWCRRRIEGIRKHIKDIQQQQGKAAAELNARLVAAKLQGGQP